jgi:hypothetical protein
MECVAYELGEISADEVKSRVLQTLKSLTGNNPNFVMPRSKNGWIPRFPNSNTGHYNGTTFEMMPSGLLTAGVLFAKTFSERTFSAAD